MEFRPMETDCGYHKNDITCLQSAHVLSSKRKSRQSNLPQNGNANTMMLAKVSTVAS